MSISDNLLPVNVFSSLGTMILIFVVGFAIGLGYFGGLWLTLKKLPNTSHPYRLMIGSFILRLIIILCCFYKLIYLFDDLETGIILLIAVLGCIFARLILTQTIIT
ncbi:MAG: ATP synthase subunit I [Crocosphaera sp.]|nr:ATP synthase subunit I [Crocosphaera sp.]